MRRLLWLMSVMALPLAAQEPPPVTLNPVDIPVIDVEASVRRMLEEGRGTNEVSEPQGSDATLPAPGPAIEPAAVLPAQVSAPPEAMPPAAASTPVRVPEKTITIESVDDLRSLADELEQAKQRAAEKPVQ